MNVRSTEVVAITGELIFDERPTLLSLLGAAIICCTTVAVAVVEKQNTDRKRTVAEELQLTDPEVASQQAHLLKH